MKSKYKINIKGFEGYRFDESGNLWKLPFRSADGKTWSLKKIRKSETKKRWHLNIDGKSSKWSENQLRPFLVEDSTPIELGLKDSPF